jgi:hypothetical protein
MRSCDHLQSPRTCLNHPLHCLKWEVLYQNNESEAAQVDYGHALLSCPATVDCSSRSHSNACPNSQQQHISTGQARRHYNEIVKSPGHLGVVGQASHSLSFLPDAGAVVRLTHASASRHEAMTRRLNNLILLMDSSQRGQPMLVSPCQAKHERVGARISPPLCH